MTDILSPFFGELLGAGVAAGQPSGPVAPQPTDERSGDWPAPLPDSVDPAPVEVRPDRYGVRNRPTPLIGTIPFGGIILDAGTIGQGTTATIGERSSYGRPGVLGIWLHATTGAWAVELLPDGADSSWGRTGADIGDVTAPLGVWLPLRRATVRVANTAGAACSYLVVGSDLGAET